MKILITENKLHNSIEKYILDGYPVVKNVTFIKKDVYLDGGNKSEKNIIVIGLIGSQLTHSPNWTTKDIGRDVNRMFSLELEQSESDWEIDYKIYNSTE
jgi:hypothetical protein